MKLRVYIIRRLLLLVPTLLGVVILVFSITQVFDPVARAALYITNMLQFKPENVARVVEKYGLGDPAYLQFSRWFQEVLKGNLGFSRTARQPVAQAILTRFPATAELVLIAAPLIVVIGMYLGVKSAVHKDRTIDHITRTLATIGSSLPSFWLSLTLIAIFSIVLHITPLPGKSNFVETTTNSAGTFVKFTGMNTIDGLLNGRLDVTLDQLTRLVLPVTCMVAYNIATLIRIMRSSMLEALSKGYVVTAKAKGLSDNEVINKHAKRNAMIPTITLSGLMIAGMLNGLVITESVFGLNGIGQWAASAAMSLDIGAVVGFTLFAGTIFVLSNLIVDILYASLDPRIRLD